MPREEISQGRNPLWRKSHPAKGQQAAELLPGHGMLFRYWLRGAVNENQMLPELGGASSLSCCLINLFSGTFPYIFFILFLTGTFTD